MSPQDWPPLRLATRPSWPTYGLPPRRRPGAHPRPADRRPADSQAEPLPWSPPPPPWEPASEEPRRHDVLHDFLPAFLRLAHLLLPAHFLRAFRHFSGPLPVPERD